jgi:hypothetical protein
MNNNNRWKPIKDLSPGTEFSTNGKPCKVLELEGNRVACAGSDDWTITYFDAAYPILLVNIYGIDPK